MKFKNNPIENVVRVFSKLPGLGPKSARRIALHLLTQKETELQNMLEILNEAQAKVQLCQRCGNLDATDPCKICQDPAREQSVLCIVEDVSDLWAVERTRSYKGQYHVLGGILSALDGVGPSQLRIQELLHRLETEEYSEIILALSATVDAQATAHYLTDKIRTVRGKSEGAKISRLAHGVPVGGDLDYLDEGTITTAIRSRSAVG